MSITDYHAQYLAYELTRRRGPGDDDRLAGALIDARVDLNPHQIDAALFAFRSPLAKGALLADEVGLGKTIEAGLVIAQHWAERRRRILVITPANLRTQWLQELSEKFFLPCTILETKSYNAARDAGKPRPFDSNEVVICSYHFARNKGEDVRITPWDLVVIDEAHHLRNVYKTNNVVANELKSALKGRKLLLLTATPLQNSLLELYGLVSFIDEYAFGDQRSFREQFTGNTSPQALATLRSRLQPISHRTLRRQVLPYIKYTQRQPMTQPFQPSGDETELYNLVSDYLRRDNLRALPASQRALMTLVLRRLLASSTFAIAGALESLARRLTERLDGAGNGQRLEDDLGTDYEALDETQDEWGTEANGDTPAEREAIRREIADLQAFAELARSITENAKGFALLTALESAFSEAERLGAERKAVIFTESRKTQDYLHRLLSEYGYGDGIVLFNGGNNDPRSREIYETWRREHAGSDRLTGTRAVDMRTALVDHFREQGQIMIATEASAEGINLQFCSLVINYDLPWNPQRIEQRIGRCHRYGQKHDVVVVNFLNTENAADQRVFDLLSEKFQLFEGVFGASDEVLGAIESGVDFERRIAEIYQTCRTETEIATAFDSLQQSLSEEISAEVARTRQQLLEHFDDEVRERLRLREEASKESLTRLEQLLIAFTRHELAGDATFDGGERFTLHARPVPDPDIPLGRYALPRRDDDAHIYRLGHPLAGALIERAKGRALPPAEITIDYTRHQGRITALEPFRGLSGWLSLALLTVSTPAQTEEHLLLASMTDSGITFDPELAERLLSLPATVAECIDSAALPYQRAAHQLAQVTHEREIDILADAAERSMAWFDEEQAKLDAWADDQKLSVRRKLKEIDAEIKDAKREAKKAGTLPEQLSHRRRINQLETRYADAEADIRARDREISARKDALLDEVEATLTRQSSLQSCFTIRWRLV